MNPTPSNNFDHDPRFDEGGEFHAKANPQPTAPAARLAHTPTPWGAVAIEFPSRIEWNIVGPGWLIAQAVTLKANADFIALAVNSHADLIAALEGDATAFAECDRLIDSALCWQPLDASTRDALTRLSNIIALRCSPVRAAIAKAEGRAL